MSIGRYLTNIGVIGALIGALGTMRQTQQMPKDWRRFLVWGVWAAGLALAIAGAAKQEQDEQFAEAHKQAERDEKAELKEARKRGRRV